MIELIPAIDIIDGKCVRLSQGQYDSQKIYHDNPVDMAMRFEDHGMTRLHLVDLEGAASSHIVNYKVLESIASHTRLIIDFGGGIKSQDDLDIAFDSGANMVTLGSIAVKSPDLVNEWIAAYGSERIILGADANNGKIAINGWKEDSSIELFDFIKQYMQKGIIKVLCTEISKDGMLEGPALPLYAEIMKLYPKLHLIASGGVSNIDDIYRLQEAGVPAVVFGKALYEGRITLSELEKLIS